jgi:large subunit ribosomal protein L17
VEKAITKGKDGSVHTRRKLLSQYPNKKTVKTIVDDLSVRFKDRPGGYTRVLKLGARPGDMADMAFIEFVDYEPPAAKSEETVEGDAEASKKAKELAKRVAKAKKSRRQMQNASRRANR